MAGMVQNLIPLRPGPDPRRGNGRTSPHWLRAILNASKMGQTERQKVGENILRIAKEGSGRDAVEAAKALWAYDMGQPPKFDQLAMAEHFRRVELDKVNLALAILGARIQTMAPEKVAEFFRICSANPLGFVEAAEQFLRGEEAQPPQPEALLPPSEEPPK